MNSTFENGLLTIFLTGRIDANNAANVGKEVDEILAQHTSDGGGKNFRLDANHLDYISSAGLRLILKLRKQNPELCIVGVSPDVYDVFEMTGFTEMINIEKAFRQLSVEGCRIIGRGAKGTVYRYNEDTIVKVYNDSNCLPDIKNEREFARKAFVLGIPTAISYDIVKVGEKFGSVFELLEAKSYSQLIEDDPANIDRYIDDYAALLRKIHSTKVKEDDMPDVKETMFDWAEFVKPYIEEDTYQKLKALITNTPDTCSMLHCDYHTNNVMLQGGETLLIDMDTLCHGHPIFELANVYTTYVGLGETDPTIVEKFLSLPFDTATYIWKRFYPAYMQTDDPAKLDEVLQKILVLNYMRVLRFSYRRMDPDAAATLKIREICKEQLTKLVNTVTTLDF